MEKYLYHICKILEMMLALQLKKTWVDEEKIMEILKQLKKDWD